MLKINFIEWKFGRTFTGMYWWGVFIRYQQHIHLGPVTITTKYTDRD